MSSENDEAELRETPPAEPSEGDSVNRLLAEGQRFGQVKAIFDKVSQILTSEEQIKYIAVQHRPVVNFVPDAVVLTNRRFIIYHQKLLGRVHFEDYVWRELADVRLHEEVLGSSLFFQIAQGATPVVVNWLPKAHARRAYAIAQEMEERVREERRLREMEEKRAAAGGVIIQNGGHGVPGASAPGEDPVQKLKQLKEMLNGGLITAGEYEAKRQAILSRM